MLKELNLKNNDVIEMKMDLNGGQDFYWFNTSYDNEEIDRRGGILVKTSGETKGNSGEAGTGLIIYHRE